MNFLYDLPVVGVSIATMRDGSIVAGAIADVVRAELFTGSLDNGARRDGRPISVNKIDDFSDALIATGFSYSATRRAEQSDVVARILPAARDIRCFGSAALHLAWVGCGRVDGYWQSDINPWDVAAGSLIAAEAGAVVELESPTSPGSVLAAAPGIADTLRELAQISVGD